MTPLFTPFLLLSQPPDAPTEAAHRAEEERNHMVWLRLRERMRALLGQMRNQVG
jgi:hypothetical protein